MKILIIEDDENILSFLRRGLHEDGHIVESSTDGEEGEYLAMMHQYDVIILDWMLPHKSGIDILKNLRRKNIKTPIIMLTAKDEVNDKVTGLQKGADDYLAKPFAYAELLARVEALYRRNIAEGSNSFTIQNIRIDMETKTVYKEGEVVPLTKKEYELLLFLTKNKNAVVSNSMIEEQLWEHEVYLQSNVIQVTIYHLRQKIGKEFIKSIRGVGYKVEV